MASERREVRRERERERQRAFVEAQRRNGIRLAGRKISTVQARLSGGALALALIVWRVWVVWVVWCWCGGSVLAGQQGASPR